MTVLALLGSPRPRGNTAHVLDLVAEELARRGVEMELLHLAGFRIEACRGCWSCQGNETEPGCPCDDDMNALIDRMEKARAVIYAAPLYGWGMPGPMKTFFDRHVCLVKRAGSAEQFSLLEGKAVAQLVTCGSGIEGNADVAATVFHRFTRYGRLDDRGAFTVTGCRPRGELGEDAPAVARALAEALLRETSPRA